MKYSSKLYNTLMLDRHTSKALIGLRLLFLFFFIVLGLLNTFTVFISGVLFCIYAYYLDTYICEASPKNKKEKLYAKPILGT